MNKLERIQQLLSDLVSDQDKFIKSGLYREAVSTMDKISGVRSAISLLKEMSNKEPCKECAPVKLWHWSYKFCPYCGRTFS